VALCLIGGVAVILRTFAAQQAHRAQASRSNTMLTLLRDVSRDAVNAETGQRGYFITLDRRYLAPYEAARARYLTDLARLKSMAEASADPEQVRLAAAIEDLATTKFTEMQDSVTLITNLDLNEARRKVLSDHGKNTMDRLRQTIARLEQNEQRHLEGAVALADDAEKRIVPLLLGLLVLILLALGLALSLALRNAEAEAQAAHAAELAEARDRADLLAHELSHRVKNLFAGVLAIIRMSGRDDPAAKPMADSIAQRVTALLKAQELTLGAGGAQAVELGKLVDTVLAPYRSDGTDMVVGPHLKLNARQATPLGLILHELVTNCVKYGAWSQPDGMLKVSWACPDGHLTLNWRELCAKPVSAPGERKGFGSTLLDGSMRQLSGELEREFHRDGIEVRISVPVEDEA
jgi:two-component sensor histidine kinase/CHASE3 domain sensor protein